MGKRRIERRRGEGKEEKYGKEEEAPPGLGVWWGTSLILEGTSHDLWNLDDTARTWDTELGYVEKTHL